MMRSIISYFIRYHVAVNVVIGAFIVFGIIGALSLKSSFFPLADSKIITTNIVYPGASPQEIEEGVVLQIEDNLKGLRGIDRVTSVSRENSGTITVEIAKGENIDFMLLEVKNAVDRVPSFPLGLEPLIDKWRAFNWHVMEIDGHNMNQIVDSLQKAKTIKGSPTVIIAHTIKGKGVSFMENNVAYHGKAPSPQDTEIALKELE